jgi:hypothetical protein
MSEQTVAQVDHQNAVTEEIHSLTIKSKAKQSTSEDMRLDSALL